MRNDKFTFVDYIKYYFIFGEYRREISAWLLVFNYYWIIIFTGLLLIVGLAIYLKPISFETTYLANGQIGTVSNIMAKEFQKIFNENGLKLTLEDTTGLNEGFYLLGDKNSKVNASFYPAGLYSAKDYPDIVSLGSVQSAPIWLFYRGKEIKTDDPFTYFSKKKISIGLEGTTNNKIFKLLAKATLPDGDYSNHFLELRYLEAEKQLTRGDIDAMFFVQDFESPITQSLLKNPSLNLYSFDLADAYVKNFPFLNKVTIPKGAIDLKNIRPKGNITLLATTINLLINSDIHPSAQWLFLMSAKKVDENGKYFFTAPGKFPKYLDQSFPLSLVAQRYYQNGIPTVFSYLPVKMATIFDQIWVPTLTLLLSFSLFFGKLLNLRKLISVKILNNSTERLRSIKMQLDQEKDPEKIQQIISDAEELNLKMKSIWCDSSVAWSHIEFEFAIDQIKKSAAEKIKHLNPNLI